MSKAGDVLLSPQGLSALLIRELSLPFVAIMLFLSVYDRKYRETSIWASGITVFLIMMVTHSPYVKEVAAPDNIYLLYWSLWGMDVCLETASMHPYLFLMPAWFTAILVPLISWGCQDGRGHWDRE